MSEVGKSEAKKGLSKIFSRRENGEGKVRKTKSFKRIRGLLTGKSRREKKKLPEAKSAPDEASTIYGVDVDDRSVATTETGSIPVGSPEKPLLMLKVVLLLMDPTTRRFELLQLEFDSMKALVSDVLAQIPESVTEESLRKQSYKAICGKDGIEMMPEELLSSFCQGSDVLVAVPESISGSDCARLATPILNDDKVVSMLKSSGINPKSWRDAKKSKRSTSGKKAAKSKPNYVFSFFFLITVGVLLQVVHTFISTPIKPGNVISPGIWLSKCGLLAFLPSCDNAYLNLDSEGKLTFYNEDKEVAWEIQGETCKEDDEECIRGLKVNDDGSLAIGGKPVKWMTSYRGNELSPWPFEVKPKLKEWKKSP